jgi:hypothetical protein
LYSCTLLKGSFRVLLNLLNPVLRYLLAHTVYVAVSLALTNYDTSLSNSFTPTSFRLYFYRP